MRLWLAIIITLSGCASYRMTTVPLNLQPNTFTVVEARPSIFATSTVGIVTDENRHVVGVVGGDSIPAGKAIFDVGSSAVIAGGAIGAAASLPKIPKTIGLQIPGVP